MAWRMSDWDIGPSVVTHTAMVASVLGFLGSFGFSIVTDAGDPELLETRSPRSPESESRRQRRKTRKRRLRRRAAG